MTNTLVQFVPSFLFHDNTEEPGDRRSFTNKEVKREKEQKRELSDLQQLPSVSVSMVTVVVSRSCMVNLPNKEQKLKATKQKLSNEAN